MPMMRDGTTGDWIGTFAGHKGAVWSCRLDALSCSLAATASGDFFVRVWDAINGTCLRILPHLHIVKTVDFSPNAQLLATGGHEGILRIFNLVEILNDQKNIGKIQQPVDDDNIKPPPVKAMLEIHQDAKTKIMISKCNWLNDDIVVVGCDDGAIRFWDVRNDKKKVPAAPLHVIQTATTGGGSGKAAEIRDMEIRRLPAVDNNAQERIVLTVAAGNTVYFYDLTHMTTNMNTNPPVVLMHSHQMATIHFRNEGGASLHPIHGRTFVTGGSDLWVRVMDVATGRELECCKGHHGPIRCIRFAPDGKLYASGSEDGTIRLWKTNEYNNIDATTATSDAADVASSS
jgi:serine-threonine kinase receptor-associated protein